MVEHQSQHAAALSAPCVLWFLLVVPMRHSRDYIGVIRESGHVSVEHAIETITNGPLFRVSIGREGANVCGVQRRDSAKPSLRVAFHSPPDYGFKFSVRGSASQNTHSPAFRMCN